MLALRNHDCSVHLKKSLNHKVFQIYIISLCLVGIVLVYYEWYGHLLKPCRYKSWRSLWTGNKRTSDCYWSKKRRYVIIWLHVYKITASLIVVWLVDWFLVDSQKNTTYQFVDAYFKWPPKALDETLGFKGRPSSEKIIRERRYKKYHVDIKKPSTNNLYAYTFSSLISLSEVLLQVLRQYW